MTFWIFEGAGTLALAGERPSLARAHRPDKVPVDLATLFRLDHLSAGRTLVCRWSRAPDGRLACHWEPDIVAIPQR